MKPQADLRFEFELHAQGLQHIAGLDEVGRGAWAGPVVAGAVILPLDRFDLAHTLDQVNDSKLLTPARRDALLPKIVATALAVSVGHATNTEIDEIGIVPATRLAMVRAIAALEIAPDSLLTDAMLLPESTLPCTSLIKGDQRSLSIAAASIVAKVTRDRYMDELDTLYPRYGFLEHKGYGTSLHAHALEHFGPCDAHRLSFAPIQRLVNPTNDDEDGSA